MMKSFLCEATARTIRGCVVVEMILSVDIDKIMEEFFRGESRSSYSRSIVKEAHPVPRSCY
jgi:hypothetical protein